MGLLDNIKGRFAKGAQEEYDDEYYEGEEYYEEDERQQDYDYADDYADDTIAEPLPRLGRRRNTSVFNDVTPLVSLSDVRSQELPPLDSHPRSSANDVAGRGGGTGMGAGTGMGRAAGARGDYQRSPQHSQQLRQIRTSLPYVPAPSASGLSTSEPNVRQLDSQLDIHQPDTRQQGSYVPDSYELSAQDANPGQGSVFDASDFATGALPKLDPQNTRAYNADDSGDPLLQRHSLSNTGDFSTTSPAYYASRSGVGHVRPAGQGRRTQHFREVVVVRPADYAEAEQIATNLRRSNAVVLVLTQTRPELAKRILDFSFGAAAAVEGQVVSLDERIYALTRDHALTDSEKELLRARGVL